MKIQLANCTSIFVRLQNTKNTGLTRQILILQLYYLQGTFPADKSLLTFFLAAFRLIVFYTVNKKPLITYKLCTFRLYKTFYAESIKTLTVENI